MKIVVSSDWHLDHVTAGVSRFEEVRAAINASVEEAIRIKADVYMFLGDAMDPDSGSCVFRCTEVMICAALKCVRNGIHWLSIAGNHDVIEDGLMDTTLSPLRALDPLVHVYNLPSLLQIHGVDFVLLPFTATKNNYSPSEFLKGISNERISALGEKSPVIIAGHLSIDGVIPGEETTEMPRGRDIVFPYEEACKLTAGRDVVFLNGHYHRRQAFVPKDRMIPIHIPGSLARLTFGEKDHSPSFYVIEVPNA